MKRSHTHPIGSIPRLKRTDVGIELIRAMAAEGVRLFSVDDVRPFAMKVHLRPEYILEALHLLERNGWIARIRKGLYAMASLPGMTPVHEFEIAAALTKPSAISHWSALNYHGLTDQTPRTVFVLTTDEHSVPRIQPRRTLSKSGRSATPEVHFVVTKPAWFFGVQKVWIGEAQIPITDPERTLLDGLARPKYCADFAEVLHAFEQLQPKLDVEKIIHYAMKLDGSVIKRLGWVLERLGIVEATLKPLREFRVNGYRRLDASAPTGGRHVARWMVQENLPEGRE